MKPASSVESAEAAQNGRSCDSCAFVVKQRMDKTDLHGVLVCRHSPPAMTQLPGPNGLQVLVQFPIVNALMWCYQWSEREPIFTP